MGLLTALARAAKKAPREFVDAYAYYRNGLPHSVSRSSMLDSFRYAVNDAQNVVFRELGEGGLGLQKALPNKATLEIYPLDKSFPWSPAEVAWKWDDIGLESALRRSRAQGGRSRREVAETMRAALKETGKAAMTRFPRSYSVGGLTGAHDRLYRRNAARLAPFYKMDENAVLVPTPLAYAQYAGRRGLQGAGIGGLAAIMAPEDAY
jgi:hypothetical protein